MSDTFRLETKYHPAGDQINAIKQLVSGVKKNLRHQTLFGVTGSGKTYTIANVIAQIQRPAIILVHNKTLAAQLYSEMKQFFPDNAVEYFVSYYDYYQPEAYVSSSDTYIEKDSSVNEHIEQMRLSATKSILERKDVIVIATVSAIYGLGDPEQYLKMILHVKVGEVIQQADAIKRLTEMQYQRNDTDFHRGCFRVRGDVMDIYPADSDKEAVRIQWFDDEIDKINTFDPLTGKIQKSVYRYTIFPSSHYATSKQRVLSVVDEIKDELIDRLKVLKSENRLVESQRLEQRTLHDLEMMRELGYCTGVENYSRLLSGRKPGGPPPTLFDYLPEDTLTIIDESHVTIPQFGGMYFADRSRKESLVHYGFRLPSAMDNRPMKFTELEEIITQAIYVSATPSFYENKHSQQVVQQVIRPTGLLDPTIKIKPVDIQVDDVLSEIHNAIKLDERVLITTLTKRMAEDLADYLSGYNVKVRYLHSDIDTVERVEIIRDLRAGVFDVLIGINLLREGLDMPEVGLVAIFDADKSGFLRSEKSLIQTIGRAARNSNGRVILYGNEITDAMQIAIDETARRRKIQIAYNKKHNLIPATILKSIDDMLEFSPAHKKSKEVRKAKSDNYDIESILGETEAKKIIKKITKKMKESASNLDFEKALVYKNQIDEIKKHF